MKDLPSWPDDDMTRDSKKLLEEHQVSTVVVACMDFRFRDDIDDPKFTEAVFVAFGVEKFDEIKLAGGAKNISSPDKPGRRETVLDDIRLAVEKHRARKIILLNHQNCGKYASEGYAFTDPETERVFHEKELRLAGDVTFSHFMDAEILLGYAWVDQDDTLHISQVKPSVAG